jgi:hypothetical protein
MFVAARDEYTFAWRDTPFARIILVWIGAFDDHRRNVVGVGEHAGIESGLEFGKCGARAFVRVAPYNVHGDAAAARHRFIRGFL